MPQPGDIGLVRIKGPAGWAIAAGQAVLHPVAALHHPTLVLYSHAFIYGGAGIVYEAEPGKATTGGSFRRANLTEYAGRRVLWSTRDPGPVKRYDIVAAAKAMLGTPYNWLDYAALALWRLGVRLPAVERRVNDGSHMMCSQAADAAWTRGGEPIFTDERLPGYVTPFDLALAIRDGQL